MSRPKVTPAQRAQRHALLSRRLDALSEMVFDTRDEIRRLERDMIERGEAEDTKGATGALDFVSSAARRAASEHG